MSDNRQVVWRILNDAVCRKRAWQGTVACEPAPGITIGSSGNTEPVCRVYGYLQPLERHAALIVAAPEMLSWLEWAGKYIDSMGVPADEQDNLNELWAIIAKAKGAANVTA